MYFKKLFLALLMCGLLVGCSSGNRVAYVSEPLEGYTTGVTLNLNDGDNTFQMVFPNTRVMPYGKYTIEDNVITCVSLDKQTTLIFEIVDDNTISFVLEGSTELLYDGMTFTLSD